MHRSRLQTLVHAFGVTLSLAEREIGVPPRLRRSTVGPWALACALALAPASSTAPADPAVQNHSPVRTERISDPGYWKRNGFVEMVPSLRLPTTHDSTDVIRVYVRVPPGRSISAPYVKAQGRFTLLFPPGTRADRVEYVRFRNAEGEIAETPVDVRGTLIETGGRQRFHTLRPVSGEPFASLLGWSWPAHDARARRNATQRILELAAHAGRPLSAPPLSAPDLRALRRLNDCAECHIANHQRATSIFDAPFPRRESDASGFYVPLTVLHSEVAVAATRPLDLNAGDPFVDIHCGDDPARLIREGEWIWYRCPDESVPVGCRNVRAGIAAGDEYTAAICRSRRYLYDNMDAAAREAFATSLEECAISSSRSEKPRAQKANRQTESSSR